MAEFPTCPMTPSRIVTPADRALEDLAALRAEVRTLQRRVRALEATIAPEQDDIRPRSIGAVVKHVAEDYGFTPRLLASHWSRADIVEARQIAMWIARETFGFSSAVLGRAIGRRDHTTVLSAVKSIKARAERDPALRARMDRLVSELTQEGTSDGEGEERAGEDGRAGGGGADDGRAGRCDGAPGGRADAREDRDPGRAG